MSISGSKEEARLRQELTQLAAALEETDEALDEWIAETERLQDLLKTKESDTKALLEQMDELRIHSLKLLEDYHAQQEELKRLKANNKNGATQAMATPSPAPASAEQRALERELEAKNLLLAEQLTQAQQWVSDGLQKLQAAEEQVKLEQAKLAKVEAEHNDLLEGKKLVLEQERDLAQWHVGRLENVTAALTRELEEKRASVIQLKEDLLDAEARAGKWQALNAVNSFKAETSATDNDMVVNWMKSVVRWSAKL